MLKNKEDIEE